MSLENIDKNYATVKDIKKNTGSTWVRHSMVMTSKIGCEPAFLHRVFKTSPGNIRRLLADIKRNKHYNGIYIVANHLFNDQYRVFYSNLIWLDDNNFQKTAVHYNESFIRHTHVCCKCDNVKKVVEVCIKRTSGIHFTLNILASDY